MDQVMLPRVTVERVVEALEWSGMNVAVAARRKRAGSAITALKAALAQQEWTGIPGTNVRVPVAQPTHTTGHCKEKAKPGGCQLHNLQCGYPHCDRKPAALAQQAEPVAWIDDSGHPKHRLYRQTATEKRLYGPLRPLYEPQQAEPVAQQCACGDRAADKCPGEWEPGCDLGNNPKYARRVPLPLEQQAEPSPHVFDTEDPRCVDGGVACQNCMMADACLKAQQAEPVGYWDGKFVDGAATLYEVPQVSAFGFTYRNEPLYATPPAAQQDERKPLTDDQIGRIWFRAHIPGLTETDARRLIRAAEAMQRGA